MYKWLYIIGGGLIGLLVKKEIDKRTRPNHIADWPPDAEVEDSTDDDDGNPSDNDGQDDN